VLKRISVMSALFGFGLLGVVSATEGPTHKERWCHFPPGQWTGFRFDSKFQILTIDVGADGTPVGGQHQNHEGDGPVSTLGESCAGGPLQG
jgi:hypothetical protein